VKGVNKGYLGYVSPSYKPTESDLICSFYFEPGEGIKAEEAAGAIAAESSTGTWTNLTTMSHNKQEKLGAKVFEIDGNYLKIAYPVELFELGNMPQIFSSIAGNIFGMKEVTHLRLLDIHWPKTLMKSFKGPKFGVSGVRKLLGIKERPICGTIIKPKLGLSEKEHAKVAYEAWIGGLDVVKDDENLSSQLFNHFEKRVKETLKLRDKAEKETGEKKMYMANITSETAEMIKRAKFLKKQGNEYAMVDILTVGWAGLQTLRNENEDLKLVLHGHRAGHAALTRNKKHGISMVPIADAARLIGVDQLHIGTGVGKMEGSAKEVADLTHEIEDLIVKPHGHILAENWGNVKPVFAVCSGGLYPGTIPKLVDLFGKDIIIQAGGGVHGNPLGTKAGAKSIRQAIDAVMNGIDLRTYAEKHKELKIAIEKWGVINV